MSGFFPFGSRRPLSGEPSAEDSRRPEEKVEADRPPEIVPPEPAGEKGGVLSATARAMTPELPRVDAEVMPEDGASFDDRVLLLLAAVAQSEGMLTYPEYEATAELVRSIFGEKALGASFQARFHYALLHPVENPDVLAASLAREAVDEKVSGEQIAALLRGLDGLHAQREHAVPVWDVPRRLRESISIAFEEERLAARRRQLEEEGGVVHSLEQGARLGVQAGKFAVDGTVQLVQGMVGIAQKLLPRGDREDSPSPRLSPEMEGFNRRMAAGASELARAAWVLDEEELQKELADFRKLLADQPFRVTLVGEGKRGKSSLINALLGDDLSPVRESVPETAAVAEFSFAESPRYAVTFLDEEQFAYLDRYLAGEADNMLLRARLEELRRRAGDARPHGFAELTSRAAIPEYLAVNGRFSSLVARVSMALPLEPLRSGMVLVDTPGLNAADSFHDYLAYEESLKADCLIFVMDARRPDSASELRLLRKLAAAGRALSIIGVLTGGDRLNEAESLAEAEARALSVLREACRGAGHLAVLGLVSINARVAMRLRCGHREGNLFAPLHSGVRHATRRALEELFRLLAEAMRISGDKSLYRERVNARARQLAHTVRERSREAFIRYRAGLPPAQFLELLERHTEQLARAAASHADQARSVIAAAAHDVDEWQRARDRALDAWEEDLVLRVMDAAHRHADLLGASFAREAEWKVFDEEEAPRIARRSIEQFLAGQQEEMRAWNEKLRLFQGELNELSVLCLKAVEESAAELGDICSTAGRLDHFLVQTNAHMKQVALFLAGAGTGAIVAGGLFNLVALGSAAFLLVINPVALPAAALLGVAAYALQSLGSVEKRKAAFLERKRKKSAQWAKEVRNLLEKELESSRAELTEAYKSAVARGFVPALEILTGETVHLRLYLAVMDKIRADAGTFERRMEKGLRALEDEAARAGKRAEEQDEERESGQAEREL